MHDVIARSTTHRRLFALTLALFVSFGVTYALPEAQTAAKKVLTVEDYSLWRSIGGSTISGDGRWVSYTLRFNNTPADEAKPVLHLLNLETNVDVEIANGGSAAFSEDSRWIAYQIDPTGGGRGRGGRGRSGGDDQGGQGRGGRGETPDEPRRVELRNLETGDVRSWQDIQSFAFSDRSTHLMLRRRPAEAAGGGGGRGGRGGGGQGNDEAADPDRPRGVDVVVHDLTSGRDQLLGSVGDIAFNDAGDLLAYTVDAAVKDSNGLFVLDVVEGRMHALDNDAKSYNRLTWNEDGTALAALKGLTAEDTRERANVIIAFPDVRAALAGAPAPVVLDPNAGGFSDNWVVSDRAAISWSKDNRHVFFGAKEQVATPESDEERDPDEVANVDVWNASDERIQSQQMRQSNADQNRTLRQAFDVSTGTFVKLADETMRDLEVAAEGRWAVGRDPRAYVHDYRRPAADFYRVDTTTGERTLMFEGHLTGSHTFGISTDGRFYLYWKDEKFQAYDLNAGTARTLGDGAGVSFTNLEYDRPGPKPAYGLTGYTEDGTAAIVNHRYDLWALPLDGSPPTNLTQGQGDANEIQFRYVRTEPSDQPGGGGGRGRGGGPRPTIDLSKPMTLSAYGQWTKKAGFYELADGEMTELVYEDARFGTPTRAADAETYLFTRQTFVEFPDLRVSGPGFADARKITDANSQQAEFNWGRRILFDFETPDGVRLQGILALPDDYQPGEKRPMLVNFYEKNSQNLHRYQGPSYLSGMGSSPIQAVSEGYITMLPDIHFNSGSPHSDMLDSVEAAVKKVIEMGYVDPERIGINGHSYGGEGAAFIGTRSELFAAVAMGAGVTDLFFDFNQNWGWTYDIDGGSGANGSNYYLYGQGREAVAPWDNPEMYMFESALMHAPEARSPFLIMHGTDDPTVAFQQGLAFYNALRFNEKSAIMLAYPGEGHGLRGHANRKDLTVRFFEFFNHYLKGEPPAEWMADGVSFIEKSKGGGPGQR